MQLEQLFVFPIASPLTSRKRLAIEAQIQENAQLFEKEVEYHWLKRGEEKFLRLVVDPATIEVVFHDDRVELFGTVPPWARLFFTNARKEEWKGRIEAVLQGAGFLDGKLA
jgi:hypothetical protein